MPARSDLRARLLAERMRFVASGAAVQAEADLGRELRAVLADLEPQCLGLYWPQRGEFNAPAAFDEPEGPGISLRALPFARRTPPDMHYRLWDGRAPTLLDDCGIPSSDGKPVVPDVVLVPCVGYSASGFRLGYGGGYFDRWLAAHPDVCAVGVAWSAARIDEADLAPLPHDMPLALVVTERGPV
jgi:5,10-methenyltetrahydrofolate synthetase